eukprot:PhF_6_TR4191/c0_g1_i1/m.5636
MSSPRYRKPRPNIVYNRSIFTTHEGLLNTGVVSVPADHPPPPPKTAEDIRKLKAVEESVVARLYYKPTIQRKHKQEIEERQRCETEANKADAMSRFSSKKTAETLARLCQAPLRRMMSHTNDTENSQNPKVALPQYQPEKDKHLALYWARRKLLRPDERGLEEDSKLMPPPKSNSRNGGGDDDNRIVVLPSLFSNYSNSTATQPQRLSVSQNE